MSADKVEKSSKRKSYFWIAILLCVAAGAVAYFVYSRNRDFKEEDAIRLLVVEVDVEDTASDEVLPHVIDQATEFKQSLDYLKEDATAPEYRETPSASKVVPTTPEAMATGRASKEVSTPGITKDATSEKTNVIELPADSDVLLRFNRNRDWGGVVLVPDYLKLARAHSTKIRFSRIEAHPIDEGHIRVWSRIENVTDETMEFQTACEFRFQDRRESLSTFRTITIPGGQAVDVTFESNDAGVKAYTLMVK